MNWSSRLRPLAVSLVLLSLVPVPALAQEAPAPSARQEARERFDRGLRLFNQGDNPGALAEFTRAQQLMPHVLVLYNIGLVHAAMRSPVQAVEVFDQLLANPGSLEPDKVQIARERRQEQAALIGEIQVVANVEGAQIEVDNVQVATTPLAAPLRVASGEHLVAAIAARHLPSRRKVSVAGNARVEVKFELQPMEGSLGHLAVKSRTPDAEVLVDDVVVGVTPLPTSLAVAPGRHTLVVKRDGYQPFRQQIDVGEGTTGEIEANLVPDPARMAASGGTLALSISEPEAVVFIDGEMKGPYAGPLRLPVGRHRLRVERADFFPFERDVTVDRAGPTSVPVDLVPTPEKRADYHGTAVAQRTWAWIGIGAGVALIGGGAGFLFWNQGEKDEKEELYDEAFERYSPGGRCATDIDHETREERGCTEGVEEVDIRFDALESARDRDLWGWIGVGVGAAALGTGIVLHAVRDDPDRYEPKEDSDLFGRLEVAPYGWAVPGGSGVGVVGIF